MTVFNLVIFIFLGLSFIALWRGLTQVKVSGPAQMTPNQIYGYHQRKAAASDISFRPYKESGNRESRAFDHMQSIRDSENQSKNIERNFLFRDLNFTDREMSAFTKINAKHQQAIRELTLKGNDSQAEVGKLLAQRKESLMKLMGLKRFDTYMTFRKTQNTSTRFG